MSESQAKRAKTNTSRELLLKERILAIVSNNEARIDAVHETHKKELYRRCAGQCWHKDGTFMHHLQHVWRILAIWGQSVSFCRAGLFHSSYSNSMVNLCVFKMEVDRPLIQNLIGEEAEEIVSTFCSINRGEFYAQMLGCTPGEAKPADMTTKIADDGFAAFNFRTSERVQLSKEMCAKILVLTMADASDQLYDFQENNYTRPEALWPGFMKPGVWMNHISNMGRVVREAGLPEAEIPPVFDHCTQIVDYNDEVEARALYWKVVCETTKNDDETMECLRSCTQKNRFVAEPRIMLAQVLARLKQWAAARTEAQEALRILFQWGTQWDKRMPWDAWVAWGRILVDEIDNKRWPSNQKEFTALGRVDDIYQDVSAGKLELL